MPAVSFRSFAKKKPIFWVRGRVGIKKPTQKNPPKKTQKNPP
jgi:hypothetical protein